MKFTVVHIAFVIKCMFLPIKKHDSWGEIPWNIYSVADIELTDGIQHYTKLGFRMRVTFSLKFIKIYVAL
jgi:hypothetical protein